MQPSQSQSQLPTCGSCLGMDDDTALSMFMSQPRRVVFYCIPDVSTSQRMPRWRFWAVGEIWLVWWPAICRRVGTSRGETRFQIRKPRVRSPRHDGPSVALASPCWGIPILPHSGVFCFYQHHTHNSFRGPSDHVRLLIT